MFCLPNQSTSEVTPNNPWEFPSTPPKSALKDKDSLKAWSQKPTTKHLFFSAFEGLNPHLRISESNPPHLMHGLVADYDSEISDVMLKQVSFDQSLPWNYVSRTFSGHRRAVWLFEQPLLLHSVVLTKRFIERASKALCLNALLPGLDEQALLHPAKYYECGTAWKKVGHDLISSSAINLWLMEASQKFDFGGEGPSIPLDQVAAQVEALFPGRWDGPFELGARGRRFWDPDADNPTAAIVRETGMQCFTGPKSFVSWAEIIGIKFVKKFEEDRLGGAVEGIYFDGRDYWMAGPDGNYVSHNQQNLGRHLRVKRGLSGDRGKKENHSEVDRALTVIEDHQRIAGALPFVHQPQGIMRREGNRYLNTSQVKCIQPVKGKRKWGEGFPWLAGFLDEFMTCREALENHLAWLQRFYVGALEHNLQSGQAVFFCGGVGQGKTFYANVVIGSLVGGQADASKYMLGETNFNKRLFEVPLWCIDDTLPGSNTEKHTTFSGMTKKVVANRSFDYEPKFKDVQTVSWIGRVIVTLNEDEDSMRILPNMEISILEKVSLYRIKNVPNRKFPDNPLKTVLEELPHFARWLVDWQAPAHTQSGQQRFGVKAYHDKSLLEAANQSNDSAHFAELLEYFREMYFDLNKDKTHWQGTATQLYAWMTSGASGDGGMRELARTYNTRSIGRNLAKLMAQGAKLKLTRIGGGGGRQWTIFKHNPTKKLPAETDAIPNEEDDINDK